MQVMTESVARRALPFTFCAPWVCGTGSVCVCVCVCVCDLGCVALLLP